MTKKKLTSSLLTDQARLQPNALKALFLLLEPQF